MTGISRGLRGRATWLCLAAVACGGRAAPEGEAGVGPTPFRIVPVQEAMVLETAGPPPSDTSVTFHTGERRVIVLRHGPPTNVTFAELLFTPNAFGADSGRAVTVEVRPRPGVYGVDVATTLPFRAGVSLTFTYARYFSAPARARVVYGGDILFERALAIGQLRPNGLLALLPSTRPALDVMSAAMQGPGSYLMAAPQ
ncbi:MAG: hypothetical protein H0T68_07015 [Gemmatimonadales bacterium]|nr:hypothetical protein [Gemmatimonadales bacterium]